MKMFKLSDIKELVRLVDKSSIHELEIENEGTRLYISKPKYEAAAPATLPIHTTPHVYSESVHSTAAPAQAESVPAAPQTDQDPADNLLKITSPMVGTFYSASAPGAAPFVSKGDRVTTSTVVCIIEAMKLMNEIEAEINGEIVEVLVENAQLVEFGQPLFLVKPE